MRFKIVHRELLHSLVSSTSDIVAAYAGFRSTNVMSSSGDRYFVWRTVPYDHATVDTIRVILLGEA